ncbi:DUF4166 domain-containing protein [Niveispirillum sp. KHB5.9]|uniref:DUF4166 domain-containing protein n=1 Tax=Niveispirillum sp. KHB5.9 TaxID=3400269 RepID=UPI003A8900F1
MTQDIPLFRRLLGPAIDQLPDAVRRTHDRTGRLELSGLAQIDTRPGPIPWLLCALLGLPAPGRDVPVTIIFEATADGERWERRFAGRRYASILTEGKGRDAGLLVERMGLVTNLFQVTATPDALHLTLVGCRSLGVPMPRWLAPRCPAVERQEEDAFSFDIPIDLPWLGRLIHYRGRVA